MSSAKTPKIPAQQAEIEPIEEITEEPETVRRKERKRIRTGGRAATIISGTLAALKKRLGE